MEARTVAAGLALAVLAVLTGCGSPGTARPSSGTEVEDGGRAPAWAGPRASPSIEWHGGARAPRPPEQGAWIGAWAKPALGTAQSRMSALAEFEHQLGRQVDVAHVFHEWRDEFPTEDDRAFAAGGRTVLLSWAGTDTRHLQSGADDELIRARARALKEWGAPVLLEWRWEMDRPNLRAEVWSAEDYVAAWKHLRAVFAEEGVDNAAWVWCPLASGFADGRAQAFYPGDDAVDWVCADTYPGRTVKPFSVAVGPFLDWAQHRPKPVLIGEFGMKESRGEQRRQDWLAETAAFVKTVPQIKGLVYFDSDRTGADRKPYDMSLRNAPESMAMFARTARDPWFDVSGRAATGSAR